ncbi:MAG: transposase [Solirubrobacteraceae bacterium]
MQNFIDCRRDQRFLLPPDVRDWLAEDHLAWFVIDAVEELDLAGFYSAYRAHGHGGAAYEPSMMVTLLMYAYAVGQWSSRMTERHCRQDVAFRVITGNVAPDHATIARFVVRHEQALAELFGQVLGLCDRAGLVNAGVIAIDGTRLAGNASKSRNRTFERIAREILDEHKAADEAEDEQHGQARGDELAEELRSVEGRRAFFAAVKERGAWAPQQQLDSTPQQQRGVGGVDEELAVVGESVQRGGPDEPPQQDAGESKYVFDSEQIVVRKQGREGWPREARRQLEARRWEQSPPIPRSRASRLVIAGEYLEDELEAEMLGQAAYEHYHSTGRRSDGRPVRKATQTVCGARGARGKGQHHRPRQSPHPQQGRVRAGL